MERDWTNFIKEQQETDLKNLIADEKLKPEETRRFVANSFRDGVLKTTGTDIDIDIDKILPHVSRFGGGGRATKKQTVIDKLKAFFEKYFGLGINNFLNVEGSAYPHFSESDLSMVAESETKYGDSEK